MTKLSLQGNKIGDKGAIEIGEGLKTNTTLTALILDNNNIGVEGVKAIAEALKKNKTLTR